MTIFTIFIEFLNTILSFEILSIQIIDYLKIFTILAIVFAIIKAIANDKD